MTEQECDMVWGRRVRWASRRWWGAVTVRYAEKCVRDQEAERVAGQIGFPQTRPVDPWIPPGLDTHRPLGGTQIHVDWRHTCHDCLICVTDN